VNEVSVDREPEDVGVAGGILMTAVGGFVDAYLFLRDGVFGFAQTGNVVFLAVALIQGSNWTKYLWPILVYLLGLCAAQVIRGRLASHPRFTIAVTIAAQVIVFALLAAIAPIVPAAVLIVTLSFVAGVRLELFRHAGGLSFVSIATTGNLMRFVEAGAGLLHSRTWSSLRGFAVTGFVVIGFLVGALAGAGASYLLGASALWGAVALEAATFFIFLLRGGNRHESNQGDKTSR
jgi:uncharacterized membrane protein YoaK (UPF0700 family)